MQGPASMTVTGMAVPFGPNTWVMPTFLPNNAFSIFFNLSYCSINSEVRAPIWAIKSRRRPYNVHCLYRIRNIAVCGMRTSCDYWLVLQFNLDVYTCGQV